MIRSGLSATSSFAIACARTGSPANQRYSMWRLRPSLQPSCWRLCCSTARRCSSSGSSLLNDISTPMRRTRSPCCARAASGHVVTAAPRVMNSRRLMASPLGRGSHCFMGGSVDDRTRRQRPRDRAGVIHVARDFVQVGPHHAPEPCQGDRRLSVKQRSAQIPLQRADGGGQRGLRDAAAAGCAGEAELLAQRQEVTDLVHLHWFIASRSLSSASATHAEAPMAGPATCLKRFFLRLYAHATPLKLNP